MTIKILNLISYAVILKYDTHNIISLLNFVVMYDCMRPIIIPYPHHLKRNFCPEMLYPFINLIQILDKSTQL